MFDDLDPHDSGEDPAYPRIKTIPVYRPMLDLLDGVCDEPVCNFVVSRWSRDGDLVNAAEQALKVLQAHRHAVPAITRLLETVPEEDWLTPEGRARHKIKAVRVRDVTPFRGRDAAGNQVVGYLVVVDDSIIFRVASSGFKSIQRPDGDELNVYLQALVEICKYAVARGGDEPLCLRLSEDGSRKGRLAAEMGRLDRWMERLAVRPFLGAKEYSLDDFGSLINQLLNNQAQVDRTSTIGRVTEGRLQGASQALLPFAEANLPPCLGHVIDPELPGFDKRLRNGSHLLTEWTPKVFPALAEYVAAFARGAKRKELAEILIRHRVPTPAQLPTRNGRIATSSQRDSTFDQLPFEDACDRAMRWLTYNGRKLAPVPSDASDEERARIEYENLLPLRKLELLRSGQFIYHYANPTPTEESYGQHVVTRTGRLDHGYLSTTAQFEWPAKRRVIDGPDGVPIVTDELVLDEGGNPVPWEHAGVDLADIEASMARVRRESLEGRSSKREALDARRPVRAVDIGRWATEDEDGAAWQWEAYPRKTKYHYRWIIRRPAPRPEEPLADINLRWKADHADVIKKEPKHPGRHLATVRDSQLVRWAYEALRDAALEALDADTALRSADGDRQERERRSHRRLLLDQAATARADETRARALAEGYEQSAMLDLNRGDQAAHDDKLTKVAEQRAHAAQHAASAASLEAAAANISKTSAAHLRTTTLANLLEALRRAAIDHDGMLPAAVAELTRALFTDWHFVPQGAVVAVSCVARLPLASGRIAELPLTGTVANTAYGRGARDPYAQVVLRRLIEGQTFEEIAASGTRETSRAALYRHARNLLTAKGVATYRAQALLDNPHHGALPAVWAALTGERPAEQSWTRAFEAHMARTYTGGTWGKSACPTSQMREVHRVLAVIAQNPAGLPVPEIAAAAEVNRQFVVRLINPPVGGTEHRQWPRFLEWVPDRVGLEARAHPCPHHDCPAPADRRWATVAVYLPETAPNPGGPGGVLCPDCSRLPVKDHAAVVFPRHWHRPVARAIGGLAGSLKTRQLSAVVEVEPVARVAPQPEGVTLDELAAEFDIGRQLVVDILDTYGVAHRRRRARGAATRLHDPKEARAALNHAFGPGGQWDLLAVNRSALRTSDAARRAGVSPKALKSAAEAGELPVHYTRNGMYRFQPDDLDRWTDRR